MTSSGRVGGLNGFGGGLGQSQRLSRGRNRALCEGAGDANHLPRLPHYSTLSIFFI